MGAGGERRLALVCRDDAPDSDEMVHRLRERELPADWIPAAQDIRRVAELPLRDTGAIDWES